VENAGSFRPAAQGINMQFLDPINKSTAPSPQRVAPADADLSSHYRGKNVLVVGGSGFIGYNLSGELVARGAKVAVASRGITIPAGRYPSSVESVRLDLCDPASFGRALHDRDIVFIVAGATGAVRSISCPVEDLRSNLAGQLNLLEALRQLPKYPRIILAGTRLVYGIAQRLPVDEAHPTNPTSAYGVHKLTAEKYHLLFHHLHGLPTTVTRITVGYGPYAPLTNTAYGVVNTFSGSLIRGEPITVYGSGEQTRDFVYIDDVVDALLRLGMCDQAIGQAFNIGHGRPITLAALAEALIRVAGQGSVVHVPWPADAEKVETGNFYADTTLLSRVTGWAPRMPLEEGLARVLEYLRQIALEPRPAGV
jgi:UDP-glucose 4-epimerase